MAEMSEGVKRDGVVTGPQHYMRFPIEPIRFIEENRLTPLQGKVVKYICRFDAKNGREDVRKAIRCAVLFLAKLEGVPQWWAVPDVPMPWDEPR